MAQDMAVSIVGTLVEKAVDPVVGAIGRQCGYVFCYKSNIQTLHGQLNRLNTMRDSVQQTTDEAAQNLETADPRVTAWLESVDNINSRAKEVDDGTSIVENRCLNGWCPNLKHRYVLSRKAKKLTADICELYKDGECFPVKSTHSVPPVGIVPSEGSSISPRVVGYEGIPSRITTMNEVLDALKTDKIDLIGISGMGGIGKTTLVNKVIKQVRAQRLFKEFAMAVVSQKPVFNRIQGEIAGMLGLTFDPQLGTLARAELLCERITKGGKVLIVLDDTWEKINLVEVGIPYGNGCKVVFTTRNERVCIEMKVQSHIKVKILSNQEAFSLFREAAGDCVEDVDLCDIAKEVVMECGGLPIAIVTLGNALLERERSKWDDTLVQLKNSSGLEEKVESSIMVSYKFLESRRPNPQPLLLLCSLFEEDAKIPIDRLIKYSMGLDLFGDVKTLEGTRNRVHSLLYDLKSCNLLLQGGDEYDECVKLHDVVRDVCTSIASKSPHEYLVSLAEELKEWPQQNQHNADYHTAIALKSGAMNELRGGQDYPNLRLLQLQLEGKRVEITEDFFQGMSGLKVFNYDGRRNTFGCLYYSSVILPPKVFQHLTNLQALSLEYCELVGGDVSSIGCLKRLKILSFFCSNFDDFPSEVLGELKNLKLLDLRCNGNAGRMVNEACVLSGLDQLEVLYMGWHEFSKSIRELNTLCCVTTLQICVSNTKILMELEEPLFEKLKRFDLFIGEGGYSCKEYGIVKNNIRQRNGDLSWFSRAKLHSFVRRTQSFTLSWLDEDRFMLGESESVFSSLSKLESLEISYMNLIEISLDGKIPQGSFPQLQKLVLTTLPALKHLWRGPAQPPSLSKLRELTIWHCDLLESLFSSDVAKCMLRLEKLFIKNCERLKGVVVSNQGKKRFENIQFPKLNHISLISLPNFKSFFYPEVLDGKDDTIHTLFNQWVSFPSLEEIVLSHLRSFEYIVGYQMQDGLANKVRSIYIYKCNGLRNFAELTRFENLEKVQILNCDSIEVVWRMVPDGIQGFRNLTTLEVKYCLELRYLMSYSVAKMLVNLQFLEIKYCPEIVGVIEGEDEECSSIEAKSNECIVFPHLQKLKLDDLKRLISFCSSKCSLEFPLLEEVLICGCPDMKRFGGGEVNAPVLKEPVEDAEGDKWFWKGNLNNGIYRAKTERISDDESESDTNLKDDDDVDEVDKHEAEGDESDDSNDHDAMRVRIARIAWMMPITTTASNR